VSSRVGMHAPRRVREWGQSEGVRGKQPLYVGPIAEVGALERCRFLPITFWPLEGGALCWLFGHTSASVQGRVRRTGEHALG
jgi:hypothetical protein